jgi:hypothetical protein
LAIALLLVAAVAGCNREQTAAVPPRAAVRAFVQAMVNGDEKAMRDASIGDEPSARLLAAQARQNKAYERVAAAAAAKFGNASFVMVGRRAGDHYASRLATIDSEPEAITSTTATVGEGPNTIYLQRVGDTWKVDRARLVPPALSDPSEHIAMIDAIRQAHEDVAAAIEAGQLKTAPEARAALIKQTATAIKSRIGEPAGTRPTTGPATAASTRPVTMPAD